jgi:hypothetical protein
MFLLDNSLASVQTQLVSKEGGQLASRANPASRKTKLFPTSAGTDGGWSHPATSWHNQGFKVRTEEGTEERPLHNVAREPRPARSVQCRTFFASHFAVTSHELLFSSIARPHKTDLQVMRGTLFPRPGTWPQHPIPL